MSRASVVLPQPGRPEEDHAEELAALDGGAQHRARPDDVLLAGELGQRARPHARRQRRLGRHLLVAQGEEVHAASLRQCSGSSHARVLLLSTTMRKVLVLNTTYEPLNVCSVRRALVLLLKDKAEVLEQSGARLPQRARRLRPPPRHPPAHLRRACRAAPRRRASRGAPSSPATGTAASTAAASVTSPSTTSCRAPRAAPTRGTTSSPRARPATARRATGRRTWPACSLMRQPRPPEPAAFVLLHVDHIHESWRPYLSYAS